MNILTSRGKLTFLVWVNILIQVLSPLSLAFTPIIVAAENKHFLSEKPAGNSHPTEVYTLTEGDTVTSVAKKFNISLDALRKLNSFRTFSHGFYNLRVGDDLEVPSRRLINSGDSKNPGESAPNPVDEDKEARDLAEWASRAGNFFAQHPDSDSTSSMAQSMATDAAGTEVQQWLNHFGTARVSLSADKRMSLKNSRLDFLMPLYERGNTLLFSQESFHRDDERSQVNIGFGVRRFMPGYMMGANVFGDYDMSRKHARLGMGLEYWRDYLKVSANTYKRLSGWKDSPDVPDYRERPASGWDIRTQAWLPSLPQLGGKLTYEQYYGQEVALFGKDNRQHNPHAITAGINYTPIPVVTLNAEQSVGESGKNDSRIGIDLNYQLGVPWRSQVDPGAVAAMRSLASNRYDFVDRNNNIVLEYRKKTLIRLSTAELVTGHSGEHKSLGVNVTSKYGVSHLEWSAASLLAAGGKIVQHDAGYDVVLPSYHASIQGNNSYVVRGTAVDSRGNRSNSSETQVTVDAPGVDKDKSTFTPKETILPADGKSTQILTLTIRDNQNNLMDIDPQDITLNATPAGALSVSPLIHKGSGVYTVTVTAGKIDGSMTLTPEINGVKLTSARVSAVTTPPDNSKSSFHIAHQNIKDNNQDKARLTFKAFDANGTNIKGLADKLNYKIVNNQGEVPPSGGVTLSPIRESDSHPGTYESVITGTLPGNYTVTPEYNNTPVGSLHQVVNVITGDTDSSASTFGASKTTIPDDSTTASILTFTAKDASGSPVSKLTTDKKLNFTVTDNSGNTPTADNVKISTVTEAGATGVYSASLTGSIPGRYTVHPQLGNSPVGTLKADITITAGNAVQAMSSVKTDKTSYTAGDDMVLTVSLKDASGNAVSGHAAALTADAVTVANATLKAGSSWKDNSDGTYTSTWTAGKAGTGLKATVKLSGWAKGDDSDVYAITAGDIEISTSSFRIAHQTLADNNADEALLSFRAQDAAGNPVSGIASTLSLDVKDAQGNAPAAGKITVGALTETSHPGLYQATLKGTLPGTYTVTPQHGGAAVGTLSGKVTLQLGDVDGGQSTFAAAPKSIADDNTSTSTLTFTAKDASGNVISGIAGKLTVSIKGSNGQAPAAGKVTVSSISETGSTGVYTATLKGMLPDTYTVIPQYNGSAVGSLSDSVIITAGDAVQANSSVKTDTTTYVSGTDMTVTVSLKDASGNAVSGHAAALTTDAVTVANATLKAGSSWKDNSDGTYTSTWTAGKAGTGLKATVKLSGWAKGDDSDVYAITAGDAVQANSSVSTDATTYVAGTDIKVTVSLADIGGNALRGKVSELTADAVTVANATLKAGSSWADNGDGTYTATYAEQTTGSDLKASLKLDKWEKADESAAYTIEPAAIDCPRADSGRGESILTTTSGTLPADGKSVAKFTLTAKDRFGNLIAGKASEISFAPEEGDPAVTFSETHEKAPGVYTSEMRATTTGVVRPHPAYGAEASTRLVCGLYGYVTVVAGAPAQAKSSITTDAETYVADSKIRITVKLADVNGNPVTGQAAALTADTVKVANAVQTGKWTDMKDGSYLADYTAQISGSDLKASLKLDKWEKADESAAYAITAGAIDCPRADSGRGESILRPDGQTLPADDMKGVQLRFTAKDKYGNLISGKANEVSFSSEWQVDGLKFSSPVEVKPGVYTATMNATAPGIYRVHPVLGVGTPVVCPLYKGYTIVPGNLSPEISTFHVTHQILVAGENSAQLAFRARDAAGNALPGMASKLSLAVTDSAGDTPAEGKITLSTLTESSTHPGLYTATLKGTLPGTYTVIPQYNGSAVGSLTGKVEIDVGDFDAGMSTLTTSATSIPANNKTEATLTLTAKDAGGNKISGLRVTFSAKGPDGVDFIDQKKVIMSDVTETESGIYTATIKGSLPDGWKTLVRPLIEDVSIDNLVATIAFYGPKITTDITVAGAEQRYVPLTMNEGFDINDYEWSVNQSWLTVKNGTLRMMRQPTSSENTVTLKGVSNSGSDDVSITFTTSIWYTASRIRINREDSRIFCKGLGGSLINGFGDIITRYIPQDQLKGKIWSTNVNYWWWVDNDLNNRGYNVIGGGRQGVINNNNVGPGIDILHVGGTGAGTQCKINIT